MPYVNPGPPSLPEFSTEDFINANAANRALRQKNLLQRAFQANINPQGQLNERGFYTDAARYGLDPEQAQTAIGWRSSQANEALADIQRQTQARALGGDMRAGERNQAPYGEPAPVEVPNPDYVDPTASDWMRDVPSTPVTEIPVQEKPMVKSERMRNFFAGMGLGRNVAPVEKPINTPPDSAFAPMPNDQTVSGFAQAPVEDTPVGDEVRVVGSVAPPTSQTFASPEMQPGTGASKTTLVPGQDTRSYVQKVSDSYDPKQGVGYRGEGQGTAGSEDQSLLSWKPVDDGTNQFRQYSAALDAKLKSSGFPDASTYLKSVYDQTLEANTPPRPNPGLINLGPEGMAKYQGEQAVYEASLAKAKGLASQAVMAERAKLQEEAKQYGVTTKDESQLWLTDKYKLRDPAKRNEAASLLTNKTVVETSRSDLQDAGLDPVKLRMVYPNIVRAYATAANPATQLSEGNIKEVAAQLFPEEINNNVFMAKLGGAMARMVWRGDSSGFDEFAQQVDARMPGEMAKRMSRILDHASVMTDKNLSNYVVGVNEQIPAPQQNVQSEVVAPITTGEDPNQQLPGKQITQASRYAGSVAGEPEDQRARLGKLLRGDFQKNERALYGTATGDQEELMDARAKLAQRLGLPKFNTMEAQQLDKAAPGKKSTAPATKPAGISNPKGLPVMTPEQARKLPSGTWFLTTDGREIQRP